MMFLSAGNGPSYIFIDPLSQYNFQRKRDGEEGSDGFIAKS